MRRGHYSFASIYGVSLASVIPVSQGYSWWFSPLPLVVGTVVVWSSVINDWDHERFSGRVHPGAALVRWSGRLICRIHTYKDVDTWTKRKKWLLRTGRNYSPRNVHRLASHCLEWCVLVGIIVALILGRAPLFADWAWWIGLAVFVGTASHVFGDMMTPTGVPLSIICNYLLYGEVWRMHTIGWWLPYKDRWWLRWIRIPWPKHVDQKKDGHRNGLFSTDSGAERMLVYPLLIICSVFLHLILSGWLSDATSLFTNGAL